MFKVFGTMRLTEDHQKILSKNFFLNVLFFESFQVEKDEFFAVFSWGRMVFETYAYPFGYFLALYIVKFMRF